MEQKQQKNKLDNIKLVLGIMDEFEDCTYCHAIVYSYILCKFMWFKNQKKEYFESQTTIAEGCRSKYGSVRGSIRWLESKGLVNVTKVKSKDHNKNAYLVYDRYEAYKDMAPKQIKKPIAFLEDDENLPFQTLCLIQTVGSLNLNIPSVYFRHSTLLFLDT